MGEQVLAVIVCCCHSGIGGPPYSYRCDDLYAGNADISSHIHRTIIIDIIKDKVTKGAISCRNCKTVSCLIIFGMLRQRYTIHGHTGIGCTGIIIHPFPGRSIFHGTPVGINQITVGALNKPGLFNMELILQPQGFSRSQGKTSIGDGNGKVRVPRIRVVVG